MDPSLMLKTHAEKLYAVCELCDDGGEVLSCEGKCLRSFHPTRQAGIETYCQGIGFNNSDEYHVLRTFVCDNCKHGFHQCYVCGMLGSSDESSGAQVFKCASADCGYFYHPECVAAELFPDDQDMAEEVITRIVFGFPFLCPLHKCRLCKGVEVKDDHEMQFAVCRRCPTVYHRKCLPSTIGFTASADGSRQKRAWDGLLNKRILIFCMSHDILPIFETPLRDHLAFPSIAESQINGGKLIMKEKRSSAMGSLEAPKNVQAAAMSNEKQDTAQPPTTTIMQHEGRLKHVKDEPVDAHPRYPCVPLKGVKYEHNSHVHTVNACNTHNGPSTSAAPVGKGGWIDD